MKPVRTPTIDTNQSCWLQGAAPYEPMPKLVGKTTADLAIIGGGLTGISAAYHFARRFPQKRILLLEARLLANGASGRNGGLMLNWINGGDDSDPELTRRIYRTTRAGLDLIESIIREHQLPVRWRRGGCMEVMTSPERAEEAHERAERFQGWGIPVQFLDRNEMLGRLRLAGGAAGAVLDPSEGLLNCTDFIRALRPILVGMGVQIHENSRVLSIREGATIELETEGGAVTAGAIVLATDSYSPGLGYFRSGIIPLHSHVVSTEPLSAERQAALGWNDIAGFHDDLDRISYCGLSANGEILFGGGSNASYSYQFGSPPSFSGSAERGFEAVRKRLVEYLPEVEGLKLGHRWTGPVGVTLSRMCSMGVRGQHKNVYHALGYSGHGIVLAVLAGLVLCDLYSDHHEPWRELPFYQKRLGGIPPEPFRWVGYQLYTRLTGRSPRKRD